MYRHAIFLANDFVAHKSFVALHVVHKSNCVETHVSLDHGRKHL